MLPNTIWYRLRSSLPALSVVCCVLMFCTFGLTSQMLAQTDNCGYPDNSHTPRSPVTFNESEVLRAFEPVSGGFTFAGQGKQIRLWYNDEHALTLGIRRVIVKTSSGSVTTDYAITPTPPAATTVLNPLVGTTITTGDQAGIDQALPALGDGRPMYPVLFITDLGLIGSENFSLRTGDWQQQAVGTGGGISPQRISGTWKGAVKTVDKTKTPNAITVTPDADPAKNNWTGIPDTPPGGFASLTNEGYGAECVWNVDDLIAAGKLQAGHSYRFQFMDHDGDQNKTGGDVGEACTTIRILEPLSCSITPQNPSICLGESVTLTSTPSGGNAPYTHHWNTGATTASITVSPVGTTTYADTVRDAAGSPPTVCVTTVTVNTPPACSISDFNGNAGPFCPKGATITHCGPVGNFSYEWLVSGNATIPGSTTGQCVDVLTGSDCNASYTLSLKVTDNATGCVNTCSRPFQVRDNTPPVLSGCPPAAPALSFQCLSDVPAPATVTATDSCGGIIPVQFNEIQSNPGKSCNNTITRTWTATDACGNSSSCSQVINVNDDTKPVLTGCPTDIAVQCIGDVPPPANVTANDNCDGSLAVTPGETQSNPGSSCNNTITRTWTATDACGNSASCTQVIRVNDTTPPSVGCSLPFTVQCRSDVPAPDINSVTSSDNCGLPVTVSIVGDVVSDSSCPNKMKITRTYRGTDACGNTADCQQIITVNDDTAPVLSGCPSGPLSFQCITDVPAPATVTASDNCDGSLPVNFNEIQSNPGSSCNNTITRTWTATDACGNVSSCQQVINVNDNTPPQFTFCPPNGKVCLGEPIVFGTPTATDNCGTPTVTDATVVNAISADQIDHVRTWTATDACGNTAQCSQTITEFNCSISLVKSADKTDMVNGSNTSVLYSYVITNTGASFPASGTLIDDNGTPGNTADDIAVCSWGPLAPGQSQTCTATRILNGTTTNIATACATIDGATFCVTDSATVTGHDVSISLTKTPDKTQIANDSNTPVLYTYVVTNTGSFFPASGTLVDDNGTPGNTADDVAVCSWGPLAPGQSQTCTSSFNLNGTTTNIATASGTSGGSPVSATATATVTGQDVSISLTKTPDKNDIVNGSNTPVLYTYVVTNTGSFFPASGTLVDDNGTPGSTADDLAVCSWGPLAPGQSQTCTSSFNLNGTTTNIATASGTSGGSPVSATATATVIAHDVSIGLTKTPDKTEIVNGSNTPVLYTYVVTNTGSFFPASGTLVDDNGTPGNTADDVAVCSWGPLAPGQSQTCTSSFNLNGTTTNIATASGTSGGSPVSASATATVTGHDVSISLTKTPDKTDIGNGSNTPVLYTYVVKNTGDFFSASGTLVDDNGTPGNTNDDVAVCSWGPLDPGQSQTCTLTRNLNGSTTNIATASGTSGGSPVSATATATVTGHGGSISLTKTPDKTDIVNGLSTPVTYTYVVKNTGSFFPASGTLLDDNGTPGITSDDVAVCSWGPLDPGQSQTCTATRNLTGTTTNIATASGTTDGLQVSATASATVTGHDVSISLTKTASPTMIAENSNTEVTYTYVVCNTGDFYPIVNGVLKDDNCTPGNTGDDLTVASGFTLNPGQCQTFTATKNLNASCTNIATATGTSGGKSVSAQDDATVTAVPCACSVGYPNNTCLPRSQVIFNESEVLRSFDPQGCVKPGGVVVLLYGDEHALTMGVRRVNVKTASGTSVTDYPITQMGATNPACKGGLQFGTTALSGDLAGTDPAGRPMWPAMFITDITAGDVAPYAGDWQCGGTAYNPDSAFGTWKGAVKTIDKTRTPNAVTVTPDADPAKNNLNLGCGYTYPSTLKNEGYNTRVVWKLDNLPLLPGHVYRLYFMVHDGDQNKTGGDVGHACTKAFIPPTTVMVGKNGEIETRTESETNGRPVEYQLYQNYPNPFNPTTLIKYDVPEASIVRLTVFNILGQEVTTLVNGVVDAGYHQVEWNSTNSHGLTLPSGIYIYRIDATSVKTGEFHRAKKMMLIK